MRQTVMFTFLASCLYAGTAADQDTVTITVIDVGQGDSVLVSFPPGVNHQRKHMLIDGGPSGRKVKKFLREKKIEKLDIVALTHPHDDHYRGLTTVLDEFSVGELWWTGEERGPIRKEKAPKSWSPFKSAMDKAESKIVVCQGMILTRQGVEIEILNAGGEYPDTKSGEDINNDSLVLLLSYKDVKVLFTGDIESDEGDDLVNDYCPGVEGKCEKLDVDVIKIPHHGSAELSSEFVKLAAAEVVLISAGHKNKRHRHPRGDALETYKKFGAECLYSTSASGTNNLTVTIGPNKKQISVDDGAKTGFTYWRKKSGGACTSEEYKGYCLETWPRGK